MRTLNEKFDGRLSSPCLKAGAPRRQDYGGMRGELDDFGASTLSLTPQPCDERPRCTHPHRPAME